MSTIGIGHARAGKAWVAFVGTHFRRHELDSQAMAISVPAHITGTVWKVEVKEGDEVAEGQVLVIIESMKMEMPVEAPEAGKVTKIHCSETQAVNEGDTLVELG